MAMKQAMVDAPLGDDVLGDDPTVKSLEARVAQLSGKEAALFVPSGTMANQIAIALHTRPGDEILMEQGAHPINYEAGGAAVLAGVQIRPLVGDLGILGLDAVVRAIRPEDDHHAPATLLCVEDTANRGGGTVYPLDRLDALTELAKSRGLKSHMDGARVMNAVVQSGESLARRTQGFDSVSFCFSKGLGAPVGSVLCGSANDMHRGRRVRKLLGGGMRQSGMLAAAALYALEHNVDRLAEDHHRTKQLADAILGQGYTLITPQTNILYIDVPDSAQCVASLEQSGVRCLAVNQTRIRMVVHLDVDDVGIQHTIKAFRLL
jgi:threonine aldolase